MYLGTCQISMWESTGHGLKYAGRETNIYRCLFLVKLLPGYKGLYKSMASPKLAFAFPNVTKKCFALLKEKLPFYIWSPTRAVGISLYKEGWEVDGFEN